MNANLTIDTLSFNKRAETLGEGSERREISRGVNLPEIMKIRHRDFLMKTYGLPAVKSELLFERWVSTVSTRVVPIRMGLWADVPSDALITTADVLAVVSRMSGVIRSGTQGTGGLDLGSAIFVSREQ